MKISLNKKNILITGGTGSFGIRSLQIIFKKFEPNKVVVFSRDELKQYELSKVFPEGKYPIRYFIGDVRDKERLYRACSGIDLIIHAAAMKYIDTCEKFQQSSEPWNQLPVTGHDTQCSLQKL